MMSDDRPSAGPPPDDNTPPETGTEGHGDPGDPDRSGDVDRPGDATDDATRRTVLVVGVAALIAILVTALVSVVLMRLFARAPPRLETFVRVKLLVSTFTSVILVVLVADYAALYRDLPNPFTRSLLLFALALLLYALAANPVVWLLVGFRRGLAGVGLGPFVFLPDLFAAVAVVALLSQSNR